MQDCYVGIDLAIAKKKRLPIVISVVEDGALVPLKLRSRALAPPRGRGNAAVLDATLVEAFANEAVEYVARSCGELGLRPVRIAIDAPSACPLDGRRRDAELAMDKARISCFATPSKAKFDEIRRVASEHVLAGGAQSRMPFSNQLWMLVGFALFERLESVAPRIEVFPQAIARVLNAGAVHKSHRAGVEAQLRAAAQFTGWPRVDGSAKDLKPIAWAPAHDCLDAYLASWVASLDESERVAYGTAPHDVIWVPDIEAIGRHNRSNG